MGILLILLLLCTGCAGFLFLLLRSSRSKHKKLEVQNEALRRRAESLQAWFDQSNNIRTRREKTEQEIDDAQESELLSRANRLFTTK